MTAGARLKTRPAASRCARSNVASPLRHYPERLETMKANPDADYLMKYDLLLQSHSDSDVSYLHLLKLKVSSDVLDQLFENLSYLYEMQSCSSTSCSNDV